MTEREICERIVAHGGCQGIDCRGDGCPLMSGVDCFFGENVRRAKAWLESHKERNMDKKQEALERIKAAEREIAEAKRIIETEDKIDPREEWVGRFGFYSDSDPDCTDYGALRRLKVFEPVENFPFKLSGGSWRYFRPATPEELGFPGYDEMRDFIERQARIDTDPPEAGGWSWSSLVSEARRIIGSIK